MMEEEGRQKRERVSKRGVYRGEEKEGRKEEKGKGRVGKSGEELRRVGNSGEG